MTSPQIIPDASDWWVGPIGAPAVQSNLIDPIKTILAVAFPTTLMVARSTTAPVADSATALIAAWPDGITYNVGDLTYGAGIITVHTAGLYRWDLTVDWPAVGSGTPVHRRSQFVQIGGAETAHHEGKQEQLFPSGALAPATMSSGGPVVLSVGAQVQACLYQTTGVGLNPTPRSFSLTRVA